MRAKTAATNRLRRWSRKHRRLYARHRIAANAAMVVLILLSMAAQDTVSAWMTAGAPTVWTPISGNLMVRPAEPGGSFRGTVRFEPERPAAGPAGIVASLLAAEQQPEAVETTTTHGGRWSIPTSTLRRGWTYRIETRAGTCQPTDAGTMNVPVLTRPQIPPLTAASCRNATTDGTTTIGAPRSGTAR